MPSFFDKLRSSMGIEEEEYEDEKGTAEEEKAKEKKSSQKTKVKAEGEEKKVKVKAAPAAKKEEEETEEQPPDWFEPEGELAVDVYQTDGEVVIQSTIAGIKTEDLDVSIENDVVTISGERENTTEDSGKNYYYQECYWGAFSRQIILPEEVDPGRAEASLKDGLFTLRIPKLERQRVKKVKVRG